MELGRLCTDACPFGMCHVRFSGCFFILAKFCIISVEKYLEWPNYIQDKNYVYPLHKFHNTGMHVPGLATSSDGLGKRNMTLGDGSSATTNTILGLAMATNSMLRE